MPMTAPTTGSAAAISHRARDGRSTGSAGDDTSLDGAASASSMSSRASEMSDRRRRRSFSRHRRSRRRIDAGVAGGRRAQIGIALDDAREEIRHRCRLRTPDGP